MIELQPAELEIRTQAHARRVDEVNRGWLPLDEHRVTGQWLVWNAVVNAISTRFLAGAFRQGIAFLECLGALGRVTVRQAQ
jgi:hypothetical protein